MSERIKYSKGQKINGLTFLKEVSPRYKYQRRAIFKCYCDKEFEVNLSSVRLNNTSSCGCYQSYRPSRLNHGDSINGHYLYDLWRNIKGRCYNKKDQDYHLYGERGISMWADWVDDYLAFKNYILDVIGNRTSKKHSIDRINNDGNYEPSNLRWATQKEQINNRSYVKKSTCG